LLTHDEFRQLQAALDSRVKQKARRGKAVTCLFTGLIFNEQCQQLATRRQSRDNVPFLAPYATGKGWTGGKQIQYQLIENAILDLFLNYTDNDLYPPDTNSEVNELAEVDAKIADYKNKIGTYTTKAVNNPDEADTVLSFIAGWKRKVTELECTAEKLKTQLVVSQCDSLKDTQELIKGAWSGLTGDELLDYRIRLKTVIQRQVKRIQVHIINPRTANLTVTLVNDVAQQIIVKGETTRRNGKMGDVQVAMRED
jgi:hypothetical protein